MSDTIHDEITRLRDRLGKAEGKIRDLDYSRRLASRERGELARSLSALAGKVDKMTHADEIAEAVSVRVQADRRRRFSLLQKVCGAVVAGFALIPAAAVVASWFGVG